MSNPNDNDLKDRNEMNRGNDTTSGSGSMGTWNQGGENRPGMGRIEETGTATMPNRGEVGSSNNFDQPARGEASNPAPTMGTGSTGGTEQPRKKQRRGFAAMDPAKQREIASKGGKASHEQGTGHEWDSTSAREAGRKGGQASRGGRGKIRGSEGGEGGSNDGGNTGGTPTGGV